MYNKNLYTFREASMHVGISVTTLKRWEDLGKIVSIKIPNNQTKFLTKEQVDKLLWKVENRILSSTTSIR